MTLPLMTPDYLKKLMAERPFKAVRADDGSLTGHVISCPVRLAFTYLEKPKAKSNKPDAKLVYSFTGLIPKGADLSPLKEVVSFIGRGKWAKFDEMAARGAIKLPVKLQDANATGQNTSGKVYKGFEVGAYFFDAQRSVEVDPPVMAGPDLQPISAKEFYSGAWAIVKLRAFAWEGDQTRGVSFGVDSLVKVANGEKLGGEGQGALDGMDAIATYGGAVNGAATPANVGNSANGWY